MLVSIKENEKECNINIGGTDITGVVTEYDIKSNNDSVELTLHLSLQKNEFNSNIKVN